jgi:hypothetical protein
MCSYNGNEKHVNTFHQNCPWPVNSWNCIKIIIECGDVGYTEVAKNRIKLRILALLAVWIFEFCFLRVCLVRRSTVHSLSEPSWLEYASFSRIADLSFSQLCTEVVNKFVGICQIINHFISKLHCLFVVKGARQQSVTYIATASRSGWNKRT